MSCEENYNGKLIISSKDNTSHTPIKVTGVSPIKVREYMEGDTKVFEVYYAPYIAPSIKLVVSPAMLEIGESANVTYTATITPGSEDIVSVSVDPDSEHTFVDNVITMTKILSSSVPATIGVHTFTAFDLVGTKVSVTGGITVSNAYMTGFMPRGGDASTIIIDKVTLGSSIKDAFGADTVYTFPEGSHHIVWLVPDGEAMGKVTGDANMEWSVISDGQYILTDNGYGVQVPYRIMRTIGDYSGSSAPVVLRIV
jgi:hypothetical protein